MLFRGGRTILAGVGGFIWGAGGSALIQQYGVWPIGIEAACVIGFIAAALSSAWAGHGSRSHRHLPITSSFALLPLAMVALVQPACDVTIAADTEVVSLGTTSATAPAVVDPAMHARVADASADVLRIDIDGAPFQRTLVAEPAGDSAVAVDLPSAPGIYRVKASLADGCAVRGYLKVPGNPMDEPAGLAAAATVVFGLLLTGIAGCREDCPDR